VVRVALTAKQQRFVEEYLVDLNATQAAIRAGYSVKNADKIGPELLGKTRVAEAIKQAMAKRSRRTGINQDRVLRELATIAFADMADFVQVVDDGSKVVALELDKIPPDKRGAIASIKQGANGIDVKLNDKVKALELLGRHLGMYNDRLQLSGRVDVGAHKLDAILEQLSDE